MARFLRNAKRPRSKDPGSLIVQRQQKKDWTSSKIISYVCVDYVNYVCKEPQIQRLNE